MNEQIRRLVKNALTYGVGQVLMRFINFLLLPVFTSYLTPSDYGISTILGLISFLLTPVFTLGLAASMGICYFEEAYHEQKEKTIWTSFALLILSTAFLLTTGILFSRQISVIAFQTPDHQYLVNLTLLSTCFGILSLPFTLYLQFEEKAKSFVALMVTSTLISISLSFFMVVSLEKGVQGLIEAGTMGQAVNLSLFLIFAGPRITFRLGRKTGKELLRLGLPLIPSFAFLFVLQQGNKYLLQWFKGLNDVGVYNIGFTIGMAINLLVTGFSYAWYPYFMSFINRQDETPALFSRITTLYTFTLGTLSLFMYIAAKPVVMIMTQPPFRQAYKVIGPSATAQFLIGIFMLLLPGIYFAKKVKYVSLIQGAAALFAIAFNLFLIPRFGIMGAAVALVLGITAMVIFQQVLNIKGGYLHVDYEWGRLSIYSLVYLFLIVFMLWKRELSLWGEISLSCGATIILAVVVWALLNRDEKLFLRKTAGRFVAIFNPATRSMI